MSRLDDLKNEYNRLNKELNAGIDAADDFRERNNLWGKNVSYNDSPPELRRIIDANTRVSNKMDAVKKQIAEEEKRIPAEKARSYRPLNRKPALCPYCEGTGYQTSSGYSVLPASYKRYVGHPCSHCNGTGYADD